MTTQGVWHVVVVITFTRIIKFAVTGQAPVTLELRNTPGKNTSKPKVIYKAISYTVGFVSRKRPFSAEAQIGLSYTIE